MCSGGRLLADFTAGTENAPEVPDVVRASLTQTTDGTWVVWAQKLARPTADGYQPLTGGDPYPADATARCRRAAFGHDAPQPSCTCGFHALSPPPKDDAAATPAEALLFMLSPGFRWSMSMSVPGRAPTTGISALDVVLSGRVLAFEWRPGAVLFRAERQTVVRVLPDPPPPSEPDDPGGVLARLISQRPKDEGPLRLRLPAGPPPAVVVADDAGLCQLITVAPADVLAAEVPTLAGAGVR